MEEKQQKKIAKCCAKTTTEENRENKIPSANKVYKPSPSGYGSYTRPFFSHLGLLSIQSPKFNSLGISIFSLYLSKGYKRGLNVAESKFLVAADFSLRSTATKRLRQPLQ